MATENPPPSQTGLTAPEQQPPPPALVVQKVLCHGSILRKKRPARYPNPAPKLWLAVPNQLLRLRAEMRVPGRAWLQFTVVPRADGVALLTQTAFFAPKGLAGLSYWYAAYPLHAFIFSGLVRAVAARAASRRRR